MSISTMNVKREHLRGTYPLFSSTSRSVRTFDIALSEDESSIGDPVSRGCSGSNNTAPVVELDTPPANTEPPSNSNSNSDAILSRMITKNLSISVAHHLAKEYITNTFQYTEITFSTVIDVITNAVQFVEKYNHLSGPERKVVVVESVVVYLEHVVKDEHWRDQVVGFVDLVGPHLIDVVVYASKGALDINRKSIRSALSKLTCGCVSPIGSVVE